MTDAQYLVTLRDTLHAFMGTKVNLVLEDNHVPPEEDLLEAMNFISMTLNRLEEHLRKSGYKYGT